MSAWEPRMFDLQREFYNDPRRIKMAYGARASGKTTAVEQYVMKHLWRHRARVGIITKTNKQGSLGVWPHFTKAIYKEWDEAGIGSDRAEFGWSRKPSRDPITKVFNAGLYNRFGEESEIVLFPIEHPAEAMDKLLSTMFSLIWISEGHLYVDTKDCPARTIFDTALTQLRLDGVDFKDTGIVIDTNPPENGTKHFLHDIFFKERLQQDFPKHEEDSDEDHARKVEAIRSQQAQMAVYRFPIEANVFLDPGLKQQIIAQYAYDRFKYRRFVLSEWIDGIVTGVFSRVFSRVTHIRGNADAKDPDDWEVIPPVGTTNAEFEGGLPLIICGWDIGDVNHAWVAVQPVYVGETLKFRVLDEVVVIKSEVTIDEFTVLVMERMKKLKERAGFDLAWRHYADSSASEFRAAIRRQDLPRDSDLTDAAIVMAESNNEIILEGAAVVKGPQWVKRRQNFLAQLLRQQRLVVSANCKSVIEMFCSLRDPQKYPEQEEKHPFDALSYCISMYSLDEILAGGREDEETVKVSGMISK